MGCSCKAEKKINKIINNKDNYTKKGTLFYIKQILRNFMNLMGKLLICLIVLIVLPFVIIYTIISLLINKSINLKIPKGLKSKLKEL